MPLKLVFLGRLEDAAGFAECEVAVTGSLEEVLATLPSDLATALRTERIKVAVNGALVRDASALALEDGDEVAFLPPVSGG